MKRSFQRLLAAGAIAVGLASGTLAPAAHAGPAAPEVPGAIAVPAGHKAFLVAHAVGVQIYSCNATTGGGARWSFVAPRADLYGKNGKPVGTHYGGPTWEARDGSFVRGRREADVTPDPTAIPWLRLAVSAQSPGQEGDRFGPTTYIQRIATTGGLEPAATSCTSTTIGTTNEVPYTADYVFWKATS